MSAPTIDPDFELDELETSLKVAHALGSVATAGLIQAHIDRLEAAIKEDDAREALLESLVELWDENPSHGFRQVLGVIYDKGRSDAELVTKRLTDEQEDALRVVLRAVNDPDRFSYPSFREIKDSFYTLQDLV